MLPAYLEQAAAHGVPHAGHPLRGPGLHRRLGLAHTQLQGHCRWGEGPQPHSRLLQPSLVDGIRHHGTVRITGGQLCDEPSL